MFNLFAGGAVQRMAILTLGIMPYISASIIIQLLTGVTEYFKNLKTKVNLVDVKLHSTPDTVLYY
jgi:Preprotein translocase subunit SecY